MKTTYIRPREGQQSRIRATHKGRQLTVNYDWSLTPWENHYQAAGQLAAKLGFEGLSEGRAKELYHQIIWTVG